MFPGLYNEEVTAQSAAFLLLRSGGQMDMLKLMKLMYLGERLSIQRYGLPLTGDDPVSMEFGPLLSRTYNNAKVTTERQNVWSQWMLPRQGNDIRLRIAIDNPREQLRQLTDAGFGVLSEIWEKFGHMQPLELVDYLHRYCPEWKNPGKTSIPIQQQELLDAIGFSSDEAQNQISWLQSIGTINEKFGS